uniref:Tetraspanin n=1 Tax=Varanus komodoensis TaxID=61221 RepID=A0A8D2LAX7_VARKO
MGNRCHKVTMYFFVFFNHLFFILGALIVAAGIWILFDKGSFSYFLHTSLSSFKAGVYLFIGVGAVTMTMGFLGCVGAFYEIQCLLGLYIICLLLILAVQVTAGLLLYLQHSTIQVRMSRIVTDLIQDYNPNDETNQTAERAWDYVQTSLSCCGWTGPENWKINSALHNSDPPSYPCSCSKLSQVPVGFCPLDAASPGPTPAKWPVAQQGCKEVVRKWSQEKLGGALGICTGVALTELLGTLLSVLLCKSAKRAP